MSFTIAKNNTFNSLEINFDGKPSEMVRNILKKFGFRWHGVRRIWYGYGDEFKYKDCGGNLQEVNFCGMGAENYINCLIAEYKRLGFNPVIDLIAK